MGEDWVLEFLGEMGEWSSMVIQWLKIEFWSFWEMGEWSFDGHSMGEDWVLEFLGDG
jgi:hypothetical protein